MPARLLSWVLSLTLVALSPGLGFYSALAEGVAVGTGQPVQGIQGGPAGASSNPNASILPGNTSSAGSAVPDLKGTVVGLGSGLSQGPQVQGTEEAADSAVQIPSEGQTARLPPGRSPPSENVDSGLVGHWAARFFQRFPPHLPTLPPGDSPGTRTAEPTGEIHPPEADAAGRAVGEDLLKPPSPDTPVASAKTWAHDSFHHLKDGLPGGPSLPQGREVPAARPLPSKGARPRILHFSTDRGTPEPPQAAARRKASPTPVKTDPVLAAYGPAVTPFQKFRRAVLTGLFMLAPIAPLYAQTAGAKTSLQLAAEHPAGQAIGNAGYVFGNFLAFLFPLPQIYKTFKEGRENAPDWRAAVGLAASLALGLVSAALLNKWFWGWQNVFGGLAIYASIPISSWMNRKKGSEAAAAGGGESAASPSTSVPRSGAPRSQGMSARSAFWMTVLTTAALAAVSLTLYFGAAAVVPGLIAAWLTPAQQSILLLVNQIWTGFAFLLLFAPDTISVLRGKPAQGFTPLFSLSFFVASLGFIAWTVQAAMAVAPGSPAQWQFIIYTAVNVAYALVSFLSYHFVRKQEAKRDLLAAAASRSPPPLVPAETGPPQRGPPSATPPEDRPVPRTLSGPPDLAQVPDSATVAQKPPPGPSQPDAGVARLRDPPPAGIYEDILGFRKARGYTRSPDLKPLPSDPTVDQILSQITKQFPIARSRLEELAAQYGLPVQTDSREARRAWLQVYDGLQEANGKGFAVLDQRKYHWGGFRHLANRSYPPGWKGFAARTFEIHKHVIGFFLRLPYHLFDMFIFGYFRRATSLRFFHEREDFLSVKVEKDGSLSRDEGAAERFLKAELAKAQDSRRSALRGLWGLRSKPAFRTLDRNLIKPFVRPFGQFLWRRVTLAVASALAMGLLGSFAPFLPLSFHLAAIPVLGPGVTAVFQGLPAAVGGIPWLGPLLSPVFTAAFEALYKDLVLGPMLNTLILSSFLTYPRALSHRLFEMKHKDPSLSFGPLSADFWKAAFQTAGSASFWKQNLRSYFGLMTVGAEIEGIMTYAGEMDGLLTPAFRSLTGQEFKLFHTIGAAVERPDQWTDAQGNLQKNPIPFGGAITWGNVLFYKLQDALGWNLSDAVMRGMGRFLYTLHPNETVATVATLPSAAALIHQASTPSEPVTPGDLEREIQKVKEQIASVRTELSKTRQRVQDLEKDSKPVTPEERAKYDELLKTLKAARDELSARRKLAERHDLKLGTKPEPPTAAAAQGDGRVAAERPMEERQARLTRLKALESELDQVLLKASPNSGYSDSLALKLASLQALLSRVDRVGAPGPAPEPVLPAPPEARELETLLSEIEGLHSDIQGRLEAREAAAQMLSAVNRARMGALKERRGSKDMLEFHKNMARLSMVMELSFARNKLQAGIKAVEGMENLVKDKLDKIQKVRDRNNSEGDRNDAISGEVDKWKDEAKKLIEENRQQEADFVIIQGQAGMAVTNITAYRNEVSNLLSLINGRDRGQSADALTEYQRRLALLPTLVEWRTNGKPGDPDYRSLKQIQDKVGEIDGYMGSVQRGLSKIASIPVEFAGVLIVGVPGIPDVNLSNPTRADILRVLSERRTHWQGKLSGYQKDLDEVVRQLDPNNTRTVVDEFGEARPESLPVFQGQLETKIRTLQDRVSRRTADIDKLAANVNRYAQGGSLPMLSGLSLKDLQNALETYGDRISALSFPSKDNPDIFSAKMDLIAIGRLVPQVGDDVILWSKSEAYLAAVRDALTNVLPQVRVSHEGIVRTVQAIIADVGQDEAYMNLPSPSTSDMLAVRQRKQNLLAGVFQPTLVEAKRVLQDVVIPYTNREINTVRPTTPDKFAKLFNSQIKLVQATEKALKVTLPWALASQGAREGDTAGALANIQTMRQKFQDQRKKMDDVRLEIEHRKDPNYTGTEKMFGEESPVSLPRKIEFYQTEKNASTPQINQQGGQINDILSRIDGLTNSKYSLRANFTLPANVDPTSPQSFDVVNNLIKNKTLQNLGDTLKRVAEEAQANPGSPPPPSSPGQSGPQPTPQQQVGLLALEALKRLVPAQTDPQSAALTYAVARYLFADGIIKGADKALREQIPKADSFIQLGLSTLQRAIDDLLKDEDYVRTKSEGYDSVFNRKIAIYNELKAFAAEGIGFFRLKTGWDEEALKNLKSIEDYYKGVGDLYDLGNEVLDAEVKAMQEFLNSLKKAKDELLRKLAEVMGWLNQLNPRDESALKRVSTNIAQIQEKTREVLLKNVEYHRVESELREAEAPLKDLLSTLTQRLGILDEKLLALPDPERVPSELWDRIDRVRYRHGAYIKGKVAPDGTATEALMVRKSDYGFFLDQVLAAFMNEGGIVNLAAIRGDLLNNPQYLTQILAGSKMLEFGDTAEGFYLVYDTKFSVPNGLETSNWVTLGNVGRIAGQNISVTGYQFASPPSPGNAPFGDKGVKVTIESLGGKNWVNYLDVTFHKFIQDIPPDLTVASQAKQDRLMVFEDFAILLLDDRLYIGVTGFGDIALNETWQKPYYYGGNAKASFKFTEVLTLNAEQRVLFAKDPREFFQTYNIDFTGLDPDLNRRIDAFAVGDNKEYTRTQVGPTINLAKMFGSQDAFTVDFYLAREGGTDDINQNLAGISVLKGFAIRNKDGEPWLNVTNRATGEFGTERNQFANRLAVQFPQAGVVLSAEGRLLGDTKTYFLEASKSVGGQTNISASYGTPYPGLNNRLSIGLNSSFTLGELWRGAVLGAAQNLQGGDVLAPFNTALEDYFKENAPNSEKVAHLKALFDQDIAKRLLTQEMGVLSKDLAELRRAGALLDNTRVRGMVGFVSNPVGEGTADRAVGGGFQAGTFTELTLNRSQKALLENKSQDLYREALRLNVRLLEMAKEWQAAVADIARAQWELRLSEFMLGQAQTEALKAEAAFRRQEAQIRLHQALLRYNLMTGRKATEPIPFEELNPQDMLAFADGLNRVLREPDRLAQIFQSLSRESLNLPEGSPNILDWIPWVERLTVSLGVQFQDMLSSQVIGVGVGVRLPVYDPDSKAKDKSYALESQAAIQEMAELHQSFALRAQREFEEARSRGADAQILAPHLPKAADHLSLAIPAFRNGLAGESDLRDSFDIWRWYVSGLLEAKSSQALASAWGALDSSLARSPPQPQPATPVTSLRQAVEAATQSSPGLAALAHREAAARAWMEASAHRIQHVSLDLLFGSNLTSYGVGWLPSFGMTGIGVTPILTFEIQPQELAALKTKQALHQSEYYKSLAVKLEGNLAIELFSGLATYKSTKEAMEILYNQRLPQLYRELEKTKEDVEAGRAPPTSLHKARVEFDRARMRYVQLHTVNAQSKALVNYLLGRDLNGPLAVEMTLEAALEELKGLLGPEAYKVQEAVLSHRLEVSRAVQEAVDKNLHPDQIRFEPVALALRSLKRLVHALSGEGAGDPDLRAAAHFQTLDASRALEGYRKSLGPERLRVQGELSLVRQRLVELEGKTDPESAMARGLTRRSLLVLEAEQAALGPPLPSSPLDPSSPSSPKSHQDLREALTQAFLKRAARDAPIATPQNLNPDPMTHRSYANYRYFYAHQGLGRDPIRQHFMEGWVEVRLRSRSIDPEILLKLAKLRTEKENRIHRNDYEAARARADILLAEFQTNARLLRWARSGAGDFARNLETNLAMRARDISTLLGRPSGWQDLARLFPIDPAPSASSGGLEEISREVVRDVQNLKLRALRRVVFEEGFPERFGNEDSLANQIRANVIADRMSYRGFTPVAAFGIFRGHFVTGGFLEAPDPRSIQRGLENVLNDSLRKELESQGRIRELTLRLHLLMSGVEDWSHHVQNADRFVQAAQADYVAKLAAMGRGAASPREVEASGLRLTAALQEFSESLVELKSNFVQLVTELEALGYSPGPRPSNLRPARSTALDPFERDPRGELLRYASERMLDPEFAASLDRVLERSPKVPVETRQDLQVASQVYRKMKDHATVIPHMAFEPQKKFELLARADVAGRRLEVEALLDEILTAALASDPSPSPSAPPPGAELLQFLRQDLERQKEAALKDHAFNAEVLRATREAMFRAAPKPPAVQGAFRTLEALHREKEAAQQALREDYLSYEHGPGQFILRDLALDRFLKAQAAYDDAVLRTFSKLRKDTSADSKSAAIVLDALYGFRESAARQTEGLRFGRGMEAMNALISLEKARLDAMKFDGAVPGDLQPVAAALATLQEMRERWLKDPRDLTPLYAVTRVDGSGRRLWTVEGWLTEEERQENRDSPNMRLETVHEGQSLFSRMEIVGGVDVAEEKYDQARKALESVDARLETHKPEDGSEFALLGPNSRLLKTLSLAEVRTFEAKGQVLYFVKEKDRITGLRPALHPLQAQILGPGGYEAFVLLRDSPDSTASPVNRDSPMAVFPTLESFLTAPEAADYAALAARQPGLEALRRDAEARRVLSLRAGWVSLKLAAYGFAADAQGEVKELYLTEEEFDDARSKSKELRYYKAKNVELLLDPWANVVGVEAKAESGKGKLIVDLKSGDAAPPSGPPPAVPPIRRIVGEVHAVLADSRMRLARVFREGGDLDDAARGWVLEEVTGRGWEQADKKIAPHYRLYRYVDPMTLDPETGKPVPVLLNGRYLAERLVDSEGRLTRAKHWGWMPWNWGNLLLEIPRGILKTPVELLTGRDPNQEHYIGRIHMYKAEGGESDHHGFFRRVLGVLDILDLLPDPVGRFYDPSQYPPEAELDSPILPGENIYGKDPRDPARDKDVHFGAGYITRTLRYEAEDILSSRSRVLSYFEGGAEKLIVETRRGRAGPFHDSKRSGESGPKSFRTALESASGGRPPTSGPTPESELTREVSPGHIEVDRVVEKLTVRPGARQFEEMTANLEKAKASLEASLEEARGKLPALKEEAEKARQALDREVSERLRAEAEENRLAGDTHKLEWRIAAQEALEAELAALVKRIAELEKELKRLQDLLDELEKRRPPVKPPKPPQPPVPPTPGNPWYSLWPWIAAALVAAAIVILILKAILRRRPRPANP